MGLLTDSDDVDFTSEDETDLTNTVEAYDEASGANIRDAEAIHDDIEQLRKADVDNLGRTLNDGSTDLPKEDISEYAINNFKGTDGEIDAASNVLDSGREIKTLRKNIETDEGSTDIDILLEDGTAIEVKNRGYNDVPPYAEGSRITELTQKMKKYAEDSDTRLC